MIKGQHNGNQRHVFCLPPGTFGPRLGESSGINSHQRKLGGSERLRARELGLKTFQVRGGKALQESCLAVILSEDDIVVANQSFLTVGGGHVDSLIVGSK